MLAEIISDNFSLFRTNFFCIGLPPGQVSGNRRSVSSIEREEYVLLKTPNLENILFLFSGANPIREI